MRIVAQVRQAMYDLAAKLIRRDQPCPPPDSSVVITFGKVSKDVTVPRAERSALVTWMKTLPTYLQLRAWFQNAARNNRRRYGACVFSDAIGVLV